MRHEHPGGLIDAHGDGQVISVLDDSVELPVAISPFGLEGIDQGEESGTGVSAASADCGEHSDLIAALVR